MISTTYIVLTPRGQFLAEWDEDEEIPVQYTGDPVAIDYFYDYMALEMVAGRGGLRLEPGYVEPDDLYGFCQSDKYGIIVIPDTPPTPDDEGEDMPELDAATPEERKQLIDNGREIVGRLDEGSPSFFADARALHAIVEELKPGTKRSDEHFRPDPDYLKEPRVVDAEYAAAEAKFLAKGYTFFDIFEESSSFDGPPRIRAAGIDKVFGSRRAAVMYAAENGNGFPDRIAAVETTGDDLLKAAAAMDIDGMAKILSSSSSISTSEGLAKLLFEQNRAAFDALSAAATGEAMTWPQLAFAFATGNYKLKQGESATPPAATANPDQTLLQSVIDGTADMANPALLDQLEAAYERIKDDPAMMELFNRAAEAYSNYAVQAAKKALG